jgi:hypothetical protein
LAGQFINNLLALLQGGCGCGRTCCASVRAWDHLHAEETNCIHLDHTKPAIKTMGAALLCRSPLVGPLLTELASCRFVHAKCHHLGSDCSVPAYLRPLKRQRQHY